VCVTSRGCALVGGTSETHGCRYKIAWYPIILLWYHIILIKVIKIHVEGIW